MTLYGFSRKDIAKSLSGFAKKNLNPGYPTEDVLQHGLGEFHQGRQVATDMELYAFISPVEIPAAVAEFDNGNQVRMQASVSPQRCKIYKPYPRSRQGDAADNQQVDVEVIQTGEGAANFSTYGDAEYYVYNTFPRAIPSNTIMFCAVFGGVLFVVDRPPERRVRFRLLTSFNDTGYAQARVLDAFGGIELSYNDIIDVYDPRKLFAHALGSNEFTALHDSALSMDDMLHAGGSVGYAVYTYETRDDYFQCDTGCTQSNAVCYPRYEVEQCTQTVNRMRVQIDRYDDYPRGEDVNEVKSLRVYPDQSFASQWPYVDFPKDVEVIPDPEGGTAEYRIDVKNPHRFSATSGWAIVERVSFPSRLQNADNRCVPYVGGLGSRSNEWHIVDVENPIARWICANYQESTGTWVYSIGNFYEGVNPSPYFEDPNNGGVGINDSIRTMPCTPIDCLANGQPGVGFWNPNSQEYFITTTISAMYGQAIPYEVVGVPYTDGQESNLIGYGEDCDLNYKTRRNVRIFGNEEACDVTEAVNTSTPSLAEVEVVVDVERKSMYMCHNAEGERIFVDNEAACLDADGVWAETEAFCFDKKKVYVCNSADVGTPTCLDICCDAPDPPTPSECIPCSQCPDGPIEFSSFALSWEGVQSGVTPGLFDGLALNDTVAWTLDDDCCAVLNVTLHSDDAAINDTAVSATVCIEPNGASCGMSAAWQLSLNWSQATFAGVTLPTIMCGGMNVDCAGDYGISGGMGIVPNVPNPTSGFWGEGTISVAACTP